MERTTLLASHEKARLMNLGKFNINELPVGQSSRLEGKQVGGGSPMNDLPLLLMLFLMFAAFIGGLMYNSWHNEPERMVGSTAERAVDRSFRASVEGTVSLRNTTLSTFRSRQIIDPGEPVAYEFEPVITGEHRPLFDARTALDALTSVAEAIEHLPEDMYAHGTKHFSGTLALPDTGPMIDDSFEYWIDFKTREPVRLVMTREERNGGFDVEGTSVSRITTMNIRFHRWR